MCEYVLADPIRAKEFVAQKASDELQINEGCVGLSDDPNDPSLRPILERNDHIRRTMAKHGLPEARPWYVSALAKKTRNEAEYEAFFKLYSRYVHPSSWLVLAAPDEADTPVLRNVFLVRAQYYGARILKLVQDRSRGLNRGAHDLHLAMKLEFERIPRKSPVRSSTEPTLARS